MRVYKQLAVLTLIVSLFLSLMPLALAAPTVELQSPSNGATDMPLSVTLQALVTGDNNKTYDVTFYGEGSAIHATTVTTMNKDGGNETVSYSWSGLDYATTYSWYVVATEVTDGTNTATSATSSFTTAAAPASPPSLSLPSPSNGATDVGTSPSLSVTISDSDSTSVTVTFYDASNDSTIGSSTADTTSGSGSATVTWSGLSESTAYSWYAVASDGDTAAVTSSTWSFTTLTTPAAPAPPEIFSPNPSNGAIDVELSPSLSVSINDPNGDSVSVTFHNAADDSTIGTDTVAGSGTASATWPSLSQDTPYSWYVVADDGTHQVTSSTWSFTTDEPNVDPVVTNPSPSSGATGVNTSPTLTVDVSDDNGDTLSVTFHDASDDSVIGSDSVSGSGTASTTWSGLEQLTAYTWYVEVDDGTSTVSGGNWTFTTLDEPLTASNPTPSDGQVFGDQDDDDFDLHVDISGGNGDVTVTFHWQGGTVIGTNTVMGGSGSAYALASNLEEYTVYQWYVVATDGTETYTSPTWSFTTGGGWNNPGGEDGFIVRTNVSVDGDGMVSGTVSIIVEDKNNKNQCFSNTSVYVMVYDVETGNQVSQVIASTGSTTSHQMIDIVTGGQHSHKICSDDGEMTYAFEDFYLPEINKDYRICFEWRMANAQPGNPSAIIDGTCSTFYYVPVMGSYGTILFILSLLGVTGIAMRRRGLSFKGGERT